jgi:hypothetical protein
MALYRIYLLDPGDHILGAENVECACDEAALTVGGQMLANHQGIEIWQQARLVGRPQRYSPDRAEDGSRR